MALVLRCGFCFCSFPLAAAVVVVVVVVDHFGGGCLGKGG